MNKDGHFGVNSAAKIFLGIGLCNYRFLQENLRVTSLSECPDQEGNETPQARVIDQR
jgi:hypothetical protein